MKSAFYDGLKAKADRGILADLAWGLMGRGFVFLGMLAFAWKVHYTMLRKQKLTWVMKIPEKFDAFRGFSSLSIGRQVVVTTSAGQSWIEWLPEWFSLQMWSGFSCKWSKTGRHVQANHVYRYL